MPKRKIEHEEPMEKLTPKKMKKSKDGTSSSQQKSAVSEFTQVTQSDKSTAGKILKQHNWNVAAAINAVRPHRDMSSNSTDSPARIPPGLVVSRQKLRWLVKNGGILQAIDISGDPYFRLLLDDGRLVFVPRSGSGTLVPQSLFEVKLAPLVTPSPSEGEPAVDPAGSPYLRPPPKQRPENWYSYHTSTAGFFSNPSNTNSNPTRATLTKLFDKYRDDPKNEPDEINVEGTGRLLSDMGIGLEDISSLVFSELVSSPSLGKVTREGFVDGATDVSADSLPKLRNIVLQRRSQLKSDRELFKNVYNHTFSLALQGNQKSLTPEMALEFWRLLFSPEGFEWRTARTPWLDWWFEFQEEKWKRAVNKDLWRQTLTFAQETMKDESLSFWSEESSWPSVIDDFVEWVKTEKRKGQGANGDAMEVEY
ncbi:Scaffold-type E3 ligase [Vermiconidia calcicola]|uniref:Scaffold-type E3 ligase n=1 Tax=Vermiconidia calcicola TaxID=1690605 RepID=A0ACC3MVK8_9PEZI|nr:Scaffold-type E3 ligase [Vermiconidia calcicola]